MFKKFGDVELAEKIFNTVVVDNKLNEETNPKILNLLGDLKYEPIKSILFQYGFSQDDHDYHLQSSALRGLINFDCHDYVEEIRANIHACYNKSLFPEFMPALVCKLTDKKNELEQLYEQGNTVASTDCNGGKILGFSLCGEEGKIHFKKALFNPNWETFSVSTGTVGFTYEAMKNLDISFAELNSDVKQLHDKSELEYALRVLFSLFEMRILDYEDEKMDCFRALYGIFYSWENPEYSNNFIDMAKQVNKESEAYQYMRIFETRMTEEILISNFQS